jgi:predicted glycosyltransferase
LVSLQYLDDEVHEDRRLGADANLEHFHRRFIDEVWLYGDRISNGMKEEILLALQLGIPVIPKTEGTTRDFQEFQK